MHELSIIENIFKLVESTAQENGLSKISKVRLKIGKMRQVVPEIMEFMFTTVAEGTKAEKAVLEMEIVPIKMKCRSCWHDFQVDKNVYICPKCQGVDLEVLAGKEVVLESVEGEKQENRE